MAKQSGLGRGLGDLLTDNTPEIPGREGRPKGVVVKQEGKPIRINPNPINPYDTKPKDLYDTKPKNRSIKANFKK